ncbi:hypothetical protein T484DRAFT_1856317 [Baffinella frigidus]|nr:hypothetical protein T484DRAFT_1856317 [Cryptophyta sp. CCMP2293]
MNVTVAAVIFEEEPIRIFVPCSANISIDPRSISELAHADGLLERIFSCAPFVPKGCGRTTIKDSEPPPKAPPGTVLRVEGLASNPEYNGCLAAVVGRSQNRYQVQLVATGRKILLRPRNLQMVDQNNVTSKEGAALKAWALVNDLSKEGAALKAWALVNDLYSSSKNASGGEVGTTAQSKALTSEDIRDLARLNISPLEPTDGLVVCAGKASKEPPAREKQLLLDLHLQRAAQQGDADRCAELIEAGGNISCTCYSQGR